MPVYRVDGGSSELRVTAHSSVHDTVIKWTGISGQVELERDQLEAAKASIEVDMTSADAGDWLKNRKMRKDMDFASHPKATFSLNSLRLGDTAASGSAELDAEVVGTLSWRGRSIPVQAKGKGTIGDQEIRARGEFQIDVTTLGVKAPSVLMFKVEDLVSCVVDLVFRAENH